MPESPQPPHGIFDSAVSNTLGVTEALLIALAVLLLLAIAAFIYARWRKRSGKVVLPPTRWERIRKALDESGSQDAPTRMGVINHALRYGLEIKTGKPFTAMTSQEFSAELQSLSEFSSDFQAKCAEFLKLAERVQFAPHFPLEIDTLDAWEGRILDWLNHLEAGRHL